MVIDLSHPEKNSNKFGSIQIDFSRKVDFLISLLAKSGIQFSPFDCDVSQVNSEEDLITLDEWRSWLNQTLAKGDPRWYWRVDDIASKAQKKIDSYHQMFPPEQIKNLDWEAIRALYVRRITWFDKQYRQVAHEYSTSQMNDRVESWMQDTRAIRMWEDYQSSLKFNPNIDELLHTPTNYTSGEISSIHKVYLVNYPEVVLSTIGINTIIGVPKETGFNIQLVIDKIQRLLDE
jgi:hypothetical protein